MCFKDICNRSQCLIDYFWSYLAKIAFYGAN